MHDLLYLFVVYWPKKWFREEDLRSTTTIMLLSLVVLDFPEQREPKRSVGQVVIVLLM
jgi:hypothetical protein